MAAAELAPVHRITGVTTAVFNAGAWRRGSRCHGAVIERQEVVPGRYPGCERDGGVHIAVGDPGSDVVLDAAARPSELRGHRSNGAKYVGELTAELFREHAAVTPTSGEDATRIDAQVGFCPVEQRARERHVG